MGKNGMPAVEMAGIVEQKAAEFKVIGQIGAVHEGPVVTTFEFRLGAGVRYARIAALADDLALALGAEAVRIDRMPGTTSVGIEVPNAERRAIRLQELLESDAWLARPGLPIVAGADVAGRPVVVDLAKLPHLLVAGATGTGKSVALNAILLSLLMGVPPARLKLVLIDPKRLEFGLYRGHRQLLVPVVTEPSEALRVLQRIVAEMEARYQMLERSGVRHVDSYNRQPGAEPLPYIVVAIDELGDLMMTTAREVEDAIVRLAQLARAVGIHLIVATQRPSYDVITGRIKANFPARMAFRTASAVDSSVILGVGGAEKLLGRGDMLLMRPGAKLERVHSALVTDDDVLRVVVGMRVQERLELPRDEVVLERREVRRSGAPLVLATAGLAVGLAALLWALSL